MTYPCPENISAMGPGWPNRQPLRYRTLLGVPVSPLPHAGCWPGTQPAYDRYAPVCAGVGEGGLFYPEANAQFAPGPTRWGPPEVWCAPGTCPEGAVDSLVGPKYPAGDCPSDCPQTYATWLQQQAPMIGSVRNPARMPNAHLPGTREYPCYRTSDCPHGYTCLIPEGSVDGWCVQTGFTARIPVAGVARPRMASSRWAAAGARGSGLALAQQTGQRAAPRPPEKCYHTPDGRFCCPHPDGECCKKPDGPWICSMRPPMMNPMNPVGHAAVRGALAAAGGLLGGALGGPPVAIAGAAGGAALGEHLKPGRQRNRSGTGRLAGHPQLPTPVSCPSGCKPVEHPEGSGTVMCRCIEEGCAPFTAGCTCTMPAGPGPVRCTRITLRPPIVPTKRPKGLKARRSKRRRPRSRQSNCGRVWMMPTPEANPSV